MLLTKLEVGWTRNGPEYGTERVYQYRVGGLPHNDEAFLANFGSHYQDAWKILRVKDGISGEWYGAHHSADDALASVSI